MRIFITGIGGFVGSQLARFLHEGGHEVGGSASRAESAARLPEWLVARVELRLGDAIDAAMLVGYDAVFHLAHASGADGQEDNLRGTLSLATAARDAGVARLVFTSSYSAHARATSHYGRGKLLIEQALATRPDLATTVVRLGLVLGPGGLFARMSDTLRRLPVVPLPDGGRNTVPILSIHDSNRALLAVLDEPAGGTFNLAYEQRPTLRELMAAMARDAGLRRAFLPVPLGLVLGPLRLLELLHIPTPIDAENLRGYRQNVADGFASDLRRLGLDPSPTLVEVLRCLRTPA